MIRLLVYTLALLAGISTIASCGKEEPPPPPPVQQEPTALELAEKELKELDAELLRLYKELSEITDPAARTEMEAKLRELELKRKALNEEVLRLAREQRDSAGS
jgi:hypothetical protein